MYEKIEHLAAISVARGVGFGALAVICFMVGFASSPVNVLRAGGLGSLLICIVLCFKCMNCSPRGYRRTEVWIMLDPQDQQQSESTALMISKARMTIMLRWTLWSAWSAAIMLSLAVVLLLLP
ncbi:MAG: hypothetical protein ACKVON_05260 [Beijerinckiaceae bacterium]